MHFDWRYLISLFHYADFWRASWLVVQLSVMTWLGGIVLGLGVALAKQSRNTLLRNAAGCYIWLFRSLPLLVLLIFILTCHKFSRQPAGYCRIHSQPVCWR